MAVFQLCGVLAVYALAVLANPINTNEGTLPRTEDKIPEFSIDVPLNDAPEPGEEVATPIDPSAPAAPVSEEGMQAPTTDAPTSGEPTSGEITSAVPEEETAVTSDAPTSDAPTADAPTSTPETSAPTKAEDKSTRPSNDRDNDEASTPSPTTTMKPAATTTVTSKGSSFTSPNKMSLSALILMLIVKMFGI